LYWFATQLHHKSPTFASTKEKKSWDVIVIITPVVIYRRKRRRKVKTYPSLSVL